ncbi:MAG: hypothetical protein IPO09_01990 [Anaeromyxobacter sp.]|nr:hypothetical protein [Anaeromyxobacter sp.]MBL0278070.1 hypothetical protein [Anaeromyxobacter sp.]
MNDQHPVKQHQDAPAERAEATERPSAGAYEPPRILCRQSLERLTLASAFDGGGNFGGGAFGRN